MLGSTTSPKTLWKEPRVQLVVKVQFLELMPSFVCT
jgi:hypothetical protein